MVFEAVHKQTRGMNHWESWELGFGSEKPQMECSLLGENAVGIFAPLGSVSSFLLIISAAGKPIILISHSRKEARESRVVDEMRKKSYVYVVWNINQKRIKSFGVNYVIKIEDRLSRRLVFSSLTLAKGSMMV